MVNYRAYEINFRSELEFPEIEPADHDDFLPDVVIRRGKVPMRLDNPHTDAPDFQTSSREVLLRIEGVARYSVTDGNEIVVDPEPESKPEEVRLFLFGSAMGALLSQRALFPLHGSAIETPRGAMVFVGPQGIGKSTLAAHFVRRGFRLLSDDVCALTRDTEGTIWVLPAFPQLRLCADALTRLTESALNCGTARFDGNKFVLPRLMSFCPRPVKLGTIHQLSKHELPDIILKPVRGFKRADHLISNLYRPMFMRGLAVEPDIMHLATSIMQNTEVIEVMHDRNPYCIEKLLDRLEEGWHTCT